MNATQELELPFIAYNVEQGTIRSAPSHDPLYAAATLET